MARKRAQPRHEIAKVTHIDHRFPGAQIRVLERLAECFAAILGLQVEISHEIGADTLLRIRTFIQLRRHLDVMRLHAVRQFSGEPIEIALVTRHPTKKVIDEAFGYTFRRGLALLNDFIPAKNEVRADGVTGSTPIANVGDNIRQRNIRVIRLAGDDRTLVSGSVVHAGIPNSGSGTGSIAAGDGSEHHLAERSPVTAQAMAVAHAADLLSLGTARGADDFHFNGLRVSAARVVDDRRSHRLHADSA